MKQFEKDIIDILNNWRKSCSNGDDSVYIDQNEHQEFTYSKNKFKSLYLSRTGEFLKISQKLETLCFNKICFNLSQSNDFSEQLLNDYLIWCFDNHEFLLHRYKKFDINVVTQFSSEWNPSYINTNVATKPTLGELDGLSVSKNILLHCEKYGVVLVLNKLIQELDGKNISTPILQKTIIEKIECLTSSNVDLARLRNILRSTVENEPYINGLVFLNYKTKLSHLFKYFSSEPWAKQ